jgi:hypothetical protein
MDSCSCEHVNTAVTSCPAPCTAYLRCQFEMYFYLAIGVFDWVRFEPLTPESSHTVLECPNQTRIYPQHALSSLQLVV